jgi:hypothetical protein
VSNMDDRMDGRKAVPTPDPAITTSFLESWFYGCVSGVIEVGMKPQGGNLDQFMQFPLGDWPAVADTLASFNQFGADMYIRGATVHLHPGRSAAKDSDFVESPGVWLDIDHGVGAKIAQVPDDLVPSMVVTTGTVPEPRKQAWYRTAEPMTNPEDVRAINKRLAKLYGSDGAVVNPTSLMRLPGSVAWPHNKPNKPGRVPEVVTFKSSNRPAYTPVLLAGLLPVDMAASATAPETSLLGLLADDPLDVAAALAMIPNDHASSDWNTWNKVGMAVFAATGGSEFGFGIFDRWSSRHASYKPENVRERWNHYPTSPPTEIGAGTLFHVAKKVDPDWIKPSLKAAGKAESAVISRYQPTFSPYNAEWTVPGVQGAWTTEEAAWDAIRHHEAADALGVWDAGLDDYQISPRQWLLGTTFCRGFLSGLLADGGVGKTAVRIADGLSVATGISLTGDHVHKRGRVLMLSLEDSKDELRRRVLAAMKHHGITRSDLEGWLFLASPKGLKLAEMNGGTTTYGQLEGLLRKFITRNQIDLVILDPFIKSHGMSENDNNAIDHVCTLLAKMGIELNICIDTPHHTRKGTHEAGDASAGRGAGSMVDALRLVQTLTPMTTEDAKQFSIPEAERRGYVRRDNGKVNIAPPSRKAKWFRLIGVRLDNGTAEYPNGDEVQTVIPWTPPNIWEGMDIDITETVIRDIDAGLPNGSRYSNHNRAEKRGAWLMVQKHIPDRTDAQAREMVAVWIKNGLLIEREYEDPVTRKKDRIGLYANPDRVAGEVAP